MKVQLIDYTGAGHPDPARHAANVLVFTKQTRLNMTPRLMVEIALWDEPRIYQELSYMANTIPSSWEFVNYSFLITDVTRAFTHQFVRTRTGSYAQQTMRVLDVSGWSFGRGPTVEHPVPFPDEEGQEGEEFEQARARAELYDDTMVTIDCAYRDLIDMGAKIEDARGILPTNILTNIVANFSLRSVADLVRKRSSPRTQGEYRSVLDAMKAEVIRVHPWAALFLDRDFDRAAAELDNKINGLDISEEVRTKMMKLVDQMRGMA